MSSADFCQDRVAEHIIFALSKGTPGFDLRAVFLQNSLSCLLLLEYMGFYLIDSWNDLTEIRKVDKTIRIEVGYTDCPYFSGAICLLHGTIGTVVVIEGLMNQQQIHIVGFQLAQGFVDGSFGVFIARIGDPDLGGKE